MSTDWNVHCVDCNDTHYFNDANHQDSLMAALCKHADVIAAMAPVDGHVEIQTLWGRVDTAWFVKHKGHKLVPISEYGHLLTQCGDYITCGCGSMRRCTRDLGHDGEHTTEQRK